VEEYPEEAKSVIQGEKKSHGGDRSKWQNLPLENSRPLSMVQNLRIKMTRRNCRGFFHYMKF